MHHFLDYCLLLARYLLTKMLYDENKFALSFSILLFVPFECTDCFSTGTIENARRSLRQRAGLM